LGPDVDESSGSISLSRDGLSVAVRTVHDDGLSGGHTRVYTFVSVEGAEIGWILVGNDIIGQPGGDNSGRSVSLSHDARTVAIGKSFNNLEGSYYTGHVSVYKYDETDSEWLQLGSDIDEESLVDYLGVSVSLSANGRTVARGGLSNNGNGYYNGHVRVFTYNDAESAWIIVGDDINGEPEWDYSGTSVSLSSDGEIIAVGASGNSGDGYSSGHVRVYIFNNAESTFTQIGDDIDGGISDDYSGVSVSVSGDGQILATGVINGNGDDGFVHVHKYDSTQSVWSRIGDIEGDTNCEYLTKSVSLSEDGQSVAIGCNNANGSNNGSVRVYKYSDNQGAWNQVGNDIIHGVAADIMADTSISLSHDGKTVAIRMRSSDSGGVLSGSVRIFRLL